MGNSKERVCAIYTRVSTEEQAKKGYSLSEWRLIWHKNREKKSGR